MADVTNLSPCKINCSALDMLVIFYLSKAQREHISNLLYLYLVVFCVLSIPLLSAFRRLRAFLGFVATLLWRFPHW